MSTKTPERPVTPTVRSAVTEIECRLRKHTAICSPTLPEPALRALQHAGYRFQLGGTLGYERTAQEERYYEIDDKGRVHTHAGLVRRLEEALRPQGYQLSVHDQSRWPVLEAVDTSVVSDSQLCDEEKELVTALANNPRGQVVIKRSYRIAHHVGLLERLFSRSNILVVAPNRATERRMLRGIKSQRVQSATNINWAAKPLFVVGTSSIFPSCNGDDWDIVVFVGAEAAIGRQAFERAARMRDQLLYCFRGAGPPLGVHGALRLECLCGPVIWPLSASQRPVRVEFARGSGWQRGADRGKHFHGAVEISKALGRKRTAYWNNSDRNSTIAQIASHIVSGDIDHLYEFGLFLDEHYPLALSNKRVAILVESTEHGRRLKKLLPDWPVASCKPSQAPSDPLTSPVIATLRYADEQELEADIVIRATGGSSPFDLSRFPQCQLVIDFDDDFDEQSISDTAERILDYRNQGLDLYGVPE